MKYVAIAILATGVLTSCGGEDAKKGDKDKEGTVIETKVTSADAGDLTIGFYETEKLATDFDFMREANEELTSEGAAIEKELINWQRSLETNYTNLQTGMNDGTLTVAEQMALDKKVQQAQGMIQNIQQTKGMQFSEKQADLGMKLEKKLLKYSEEFAEANGIKLLFARGPGSGISYIDGAFDVTDDFIKYMNARQKELMGETASDQ